MKQVVIIAGGKGSRLKSISDNLPKPMVEILGVPILEHSINKCAEFGIKDIKLLVSYKNEIIENYFRDGKKFDVNIEYILEKKPRGTGGALLDALPKLNDQFIVIYGDTYFDIDLRAFWDFHDHSQGDASIFLHPNDHPIDSDLVEVNDALRVMKIHPYPHKSGWRRNLVNAALYAFNKSAFDGLKFSSPTLDIARDIFPNMLMKEKNIFGYISTEYIKDMGTPERLSRVISDITSGKVRSLKRETPKIAIFIDRDGTINEEIDFLNHHDQFVLIKGASEAISKINHLGALVIVVTNQPVIARGDLKESDLEVIHNKMETLLGKDGAYVDRIYYCPHHTDSGFDGEVKALKFDCDCRKPKTGMFLQAKSELNIDFKKSWVIGDSTTDIMAASNAGLKSVLVKTGYGGKDKKFKIKPNFVAKNLEEATDLIIKEINSHDCN